MTPQIADRTSGAWLKQACLLLYLTCLISPLPAWAERDAPGQKEEWEQIRDALDEMRNRAREQRAHAVRRYDLAVAKCNQKVFNAKCIDKAKLARVEGEREAARIEKSALAIEKYVKSETRTAKKQQRIEKEQNRLSTAKKKEVEMQNKKEKAALQLEKLRPVEVSADKSAE